MLVLSRGQIQAQVGAKAFLRHQLFSSSPARLVWIPNASCLPVNRKSSEIQIVVVRGDPAYSGCFYLEIRLEGFVLFHFMDSGT